MKAMELFINQSYITFTPLLLFHKQELAMSVSTMIPPPQAALKELGIQSTRIHYQLSPSELTEQSVQRGEGVLSDTGALVIKTGEFTGRSPKDKFIVKDAITA